MPLWVAVRHSLVRVAASLATPLWVAVQALKPACTCFGAASCQPLLLLCAEYVPEGSDSVVLAQEQITGEELDVDAKVNFCNAGSVCSCATLLQWAPPPQHGAAWAAHVTAGQS